MKLSVTATSFGTLFTSRVVLSNEQIFQVVEASFEKKVSVSKEKEHDKRLELDDKFHRLKENLKAKTDIREELWFHQGQGYLVTSEESLPLKKGLSRTPV
jgi:hypothetical protein